MKEEKMKTRETPARFSKSKLDRCALITVGLLSLAAGIIGIFAPVWPTTCFLLLAAGCFSKSSQRLHGWMMSNRLFGSYLQRYKEHGTIGSRVRIGSLVILWTSLLLSSWLVGFSAWISLLLFVVGSGVTAHLLKLPTEANQGSRLNKSGKCQEGQLLMTRQHFSTQVSPNSPWA
jgi:uncharacterized membrane protein YbaN (DUF454 family)